jgi:predicted ATPase
VFDPGVDSLCALVEILYLLGYPDQALARSQEALGLARQTAHPFSVAHACHFAARLHRRRGELTDAQALEEASQALCHAQGFAQEIAEAMVVQGGDLVRQGQIAAGLGQMRQGIEASRATGCELRRPWLLSALAVAYGQAGQVDEGLAVLDEALGIVETTGKRLDEAGLYRRKGELLMQQSQGRQTTDPRQAWQEAEACFQQALMVARRQQGRLMELRAATSLARLWKSQGNRNEAHELLAPVYSWFTEGFDTVDLREAKMLLAELV